MNSAHHVIKHISNPRSLSYTASHDVANTIHQSLPGVAQERDAAGDLCADDDRRGRWRR
jgi:hypothetical protein